MIVHRKIEQAIRDSLFKGKTLILYGARQTGKTTLVKKLVAERSDGSYFLCEEPDVAAALTGATSTAMRAFFGKHSLVVLDEAQRLPEPGLTLKLLHDSSPDIQIIATGSSSFDLASHVNEPLTGRKKIFHLSPLSMLELTQVSGSLETDRLLGRRIVYGCYPEVVTTEGNEAQHLLSEICSSYVYKDILSLDRIRHPLVIEKLLAALAYQIGNEVSYGELGQMLGINHETVDRYIRILEQAFVVFRLSSYSSNLRNELKRNRKIYFWDTGIRNALIRNFAPLDTRDDTGALWENFIISERLKALYNYQQNRGSYFWRAAKPASGEIDYVEQDNATLTAWEMKWKEKKVHLPVLFSRSYPQTPIACVSPQSWRSFVGYRLLEG